jgi:integrase/recombinase XerD
VELIRLHQFAEKLDLLGYSPRSIEAYCYDVNRFFTWMKEHENIDTLDSVLPEHLTAYHAYLQYEKSTRKTYLNGITLHHRLFALKTFYKVMFKERLIKQDYAALITPPRQKRHLPRNVPGEKELASMLDNIKPVNPLEIRNRAILEVLYATGIRNMELRQLKIEDLNRSASTLFIRGKGSKDRIVPVGAWVMPYLMEYLESARPKLVRKKKTDLLLVTKTGRPIPSANLIYIIRTRAQAAGIQQRISPHALRHACATHMLKGGADIRYIQELLGHSELSTTQIYTHVDITTLKRAHQRFHPREHATDGE